ncbi:hypothetical protein RFI_36729 [Reticulomyxa filosa]|uniref:Uncharacterized protein n=1 Tax=Reticulomyxa filosa TaxID=46433 RepID=X6LH46_RETFI|nr:hypothetical protein RFI_36729 [Reticulomyxa filosa]|eukprot:ETO00711.1 hypothetical protein RFI_36729 [Reticulomyxa filosa]
MLAQLRKRFSKIDKEIISDAIKWFGENVKETEDILTWLTENTTNLQQQHYLMYLVQLFGNKLGKTAILQVWSNCNQILVDTNMKLREICATSNLNELNVNEVIREMCLHILWNILKYPKHIKYRQIHKQALYNYLSKKCHTLGADFECVFVNMQELLQYYGFKVEDNDNWYCQYNHTQLLHLWNCYRSAIDQQIMYVFILLSIKQMI